MKRLILVSVVTIFALLASVGLTLGVGFPLCEDPHQPPPSGAYGWNVYNGVINHYDPVTDSFFGLVDDYFDLPVPQFYDSVTDIFYWDIGPSCTYNGNMVWHLHGYFDGHEDPDPNGCGHGCLEYWSNPGIPFLSFGSTEINVPSASFLGNYYGFALDFDSSKLPDLSFKLNLNSITSAPAQGGAANITQTSDFSWLYFPRFMNGYDGTTSTLRFRYNGSLSFGLDAYWPGGGNRFTADNALAFGSDAYLSKYFAKRYYDFVPTYGTFVSSAATTPRTATCPTGFFSYFSAGANAAAFQSDGCTDQAGNTWSGTFTLRNDGTNFALAASNLNYTTAVEGITIGLTYKNTVMSGTNTFVTPGNYYSYTGQMEGDVSALINGKYAWYVYNQARSTAQYNMTSGNITFMSFGGNIYGGAAGGWFRSSVAVPPVDTFDLVPLSGTSIIKSVVNDGNSISITNSNGSTIIGYNGRPVGTFDSIGSMIRYNF